jgi:hypothetical protein
MDSVAKKPRTEATPPNGEDFSFLDNGDMSPIMQPMFPDFETMGIFCPPSPSPPRSPLPAIGHRTNIFVKNKELKMPADDINSSAHGVASKSANPFARKKESKMPADDVDSSAHDVASKKGREIPEVFKPKRKPGLRAKRPDQPGESSSEPIKKKKGEYSATLTRMLSDFLLASTYC